MDAQEYFESLTAQNYPAEEAEKYTQEHYPDFSLAPTAPAPIVMPASGFTGIPAPGLTGMPGANIPQQIIQVKQPSAAWRILNGLSGLILSGIIMFTAYAVKSDYDQINAFIDAFGISMTDDIESAISTISIMYLLVILISIGLLIVSIIQFVNKPWGSKALLGNTGLLFVMLVLTGYFESALNEDIGGNGTFFEMNGMVLSYCSGLCFLVFGLFAFLGRQKGPSVELQM